MLVHMTRLMDPLGCNLGFEKGNQKGIPCPFHKNVGDSVFHPYLREGWDWWVKLVLPENIRKTYLGGGWWWFEIWFFMFTPIFERFPSWRAYVIGSTTNQNKIKRPNGLIVQNVLVFFKLFAGINFPQKEKMGSPKKQHPFSTCGNGIWLCSKPSVRIPTSQSKVRWKNKSLHLWLTTLAYLDRCSV